MKSSLETSQDLRDFYMTSYGRLVGALTLAAGSRETAEEIAQEAFARLIPRWTDVSGYDNPEAWLRKVAFRLLTDHRRRVSRAARHLWSPGVQIRSPDVDVVIDVENALRHLTLAQRQVVLLYHVYDLPVDEVARILNIRPGTVKSRLARSRAIMEIHLAAEGVNDA